MNSMTKIRRAAVLLATAGGLLAGATIGLAEPSDAPPVDETRQAQQREAATAPSTRGANGYQDDFINVAGPAAQVVMAEYRVPASVGTAQAILESNWGRSSLSVNDKNYFGFKCTSAGSPGPIAIGCHAYSTQECTPTCHTVTAYFRVYASMTDSFRDYGRLLSTSSYYAPAFQYLDNPDQFAREIAKHYATDPDYASKVIGLMQSWNLYRFNTAVSGDAAGAMWHQIRNAAGTAWSGFAPIAGAGTTQHGAAKDVSIAGMSDGSAQALIVGSDDTVYHQIRNADNLTWTGFSAVAGAGTSVPAKAKRASIAAMPDGSAQVVIIGADGKVYHQIRNADNLTWSGFQPVSGAGTNVAAGAKDVAITGMSNGDAHVVIIGDDDTVYHTIRTAAGPTWTGFGALSGAGTSVPAKGKRVSVAGMPDGSAQVLMTSTDNTVYHTIRNADGQSWSGFSAVSGSGTSVPAKGTDVAITAMPNGDAQVLITSEDGTVYHQIRTVAGPAWTGFSAVSGAGTTQAAHAHKVSIAGMPDNSAQVFIVGK